jgi:hypothetical protein
LIILLPHGVEVEQDVTSHHGSLYNYMYRPSSCRRNQARCKRWSGVTSQRGLPREPVHTCTDPWMMLLYGRRESLARCMCCVEPVLPFRSPIRSKTMSILCWQPVPAAMREIELVSGQRPQCLGGLLIVVHMSPYCRLASRELFSKTNISLEQRYADLKGVMIKTSSKFDNAA